jgi:hypothetical protein
MIFRDDEIIAEANRLRQSAWMNSDAGLTDQEVELKQLRRQHIPKRPGVTFGPMTGDVKSAALWLATNIDEADRPLRPFIAQIFDMSFDDAGRVVAEAERLLGRPL